MKIIDTHLEVGDQIMFDIMTTAVESGSHGIGYWCYIKKITRAEDLSITEFTLKILEDGHEPGKIFKVDTDIVALGIQRSLTGGKANVDGFISELLRDITAKEQSGTGIDAEAADIIIQLGLFNELIYG